MMNKPDDVVCLDKPVTLKKKEGLIFAGSCAPSLDPGLVSLVEV